MFLIFKTSMKETFTLYKLPNDYEDFCIIFFQVKSSRLKNKTKNQKTCNKIIDYYFRISYSFDSLFGYLSKYKSGIWSLFYFVYNQLDQKSKGQSMFKFILIKTSFQSSTGNCLLVQTSQNSIWKILLYSIILKILRRKVSQFSPVFFIKRYLILT